MGEKTLVDNDEWDKKDFYLQNCHKSMERQGVEKVMLKAVLLHYLSSLNVESAGTIFYTMAEIYISDNPNIPCFDITEEDTSIRPYTEALVSILDILSQTYSGQGLDD